MRIGITAGDPAGVGFEVILKAIPDVLAEAQWILFGHRADFEVNHREFARSLPYSDVSDLTPDSRPGLYFHHTGGEGDATQWGASNRETGRRALEGLEAAGRWALDGDIDALVTGPLSKRFAGPDFRGQTEFLARQADTSPVAMSFFTPTFKVVLATTHLPLSEVPARLSEGLYGELLDLIEEEMRRLGSPHPRIAVAALNPHAGEAGLFGLEDDRVIRPAIEAAALRGLDVSGPHPADSLYLRAHRGEFDVILAPYHDQGLIPVKLIAPGSATNVTLGLPYVRTSPDHGTALQIAGRGVAEWKSMHSAYRLAIDLFQLQLEAIEEAG